MKIALFGYGKMGRLIEHMALEAGHEIDLRVDEHNRALVTLQELRAVEVAIDFSRPDAVLENIEMALAAGIPLVVGTTGWAEDLPAVTQRVQQMNGSLFHASNFSIGVNRFFATARQLARRMKEEPYRATISETHHTEKLDAPSGTALSLAAIVEAELATEVPITAHRETDVPGTHILRFTSPIDTIELTHIAHSREGFARGALQAAAWLPGRRGVFTMHDLLEES